MPPFGQAGKARQPYPSAAGPPSFLSALQCLPRLEEELTRASIRGPREIEDFVGWSIAGPYGDA